MEIYRDYDLTELNTFRINARAKFFVEVKNEDELGELFTEPVFKDNKKMFLGGGSNILFVKDFNGLVIKISILGREIVDQDDKNISLRIGAGEDWHSFVEYTVSNDWGGLENLAFIPGNVGAAPVQNIAAYGENLSDVFEFLEAFNVETGEIRKFTKEECDFGYRSSIFKKELKYKYIITRVSFVLNKNPQIETSYYQMGINRDSIKEELKKITQEPYSIKDVFNAVVSIRKRKLPDPKTIPTVGSFFLNCVVSKNKYEELKSKDSELQCYPLDQLVYKDLNDLEKEAYVKVATGRLLQNLGWLGKWEGNVGVHDKHALVLVTNGKASGEEVVAFANKIKENFKEVYGIDLQTEVNLI